MIDLFVRTHWYIPSLIVLVLVFLVFLAWIFGTDIYDKIDNNMKLDDELSSFVVNHVLISAISTILWFTLNSYPLFRVLCIFWNSWVLLVLTGSLLYMIGLMFKTLRNYCLTKRGKK